MVHERRANERCAASADCFMPFSSPVAGACCCRLSGVGLREFGERSYLSSMQASHVSFQSFRN